MSVVRDPAFWKRFSTAVHLDDMARAEQAQQPKRVRTDEWLERQTSKKRHRTLVCLVFWVLFVLLAGGLVVLIIWLSNTNRLKKDKNAV